MRIGFERAVLLSIVAIVAYLGRPAQCWSQRRPARPENLVTALSAPAKTHFIKTPLIDVIDSLKREHGIEIQIDQRALAQVGLKPSSLVTANFQREISLQSTLLLTLHQLDLVCVLQNESLLVTTPDGARRWGGVIPGLTTPKPPAKAPRTPTGKAIVEALASSTSLEFNETPLADVVTYLQERHKIPIVIDERALKAVGMDASAPVTRTAKDISLKSGLVLITATLELTCVRQDDFLMVTTPKVAALWGGPLPMARAGPGEQEIQEALKPDTKPDTRVKPKLRIWTDSSGKYKIQAELVTVSDGKVELKKSDGTTVTVPLEKLSQADLVWLHKQE